VVLLLVFLLVFAVSAVRVDLEAFIFIGVHFRLNIVIIMP